MLYKVTKQNKFDATRFLSFFFEKSKINLFESTIVCGKKYLNQEIFYAEAIFSIKALIRNM
jgi:hypothetical protein